MTATSSRSRAWNRLALAAVVACAGCSAKYGESDPLPLAPAPEANGTAQPPVDGDSPALDPAATTTPLPPAGNQATTCDPTHGFVSVTDVAGFAYPEGDYGPPRLSKDELTLFVSMQSGPGIVALYTASRTSVADAFGPATLVSGMATSAPNSYELSPNLSNDGLSLVYEGMPGTSMAATSLFVTTRASLVAPFGAPSAVALSTTNPEAPYVLGSGKAVYYAAAGQLHRASMPLLGGGDVATFPELDDSANGKAGDRFPVVRDDELAIYWMASKSNGAVGTSDLFVATRSSTTRPFGAIRAVAEVNTPTGDEYPSWISGDGCRVYTMTFDPNGGMPVARLRVATLAR